MSAMPHASVASNAVTTKPTSALWRKNVEARRKMLRASYNREFDRFVKGLLPEYNKQFNPRSSWHAIPFDIKLNIIKIKWDTLLLQKKVQLHFTVEIHSSTNTKVFAKIDRNLKFGDVVKKYCRVVKKEDCERLNNSYKDIVKLPEHPHVCDIKDIHWMEQQSTGTILLYVQMSRVNGVPLHDMIANDELYSMLSHDISSSVVRLVFCLISVNIMLKNNGCIWGDISTSNIMVNMLLFGDQFVPMFTLFDPCLLEGYYGSGVKVDYVAPECAKHVGIDKDRKLVHNDLWSSMICVFEMVARKKALFDVEPATMKLMKLKSLHEKNINSTESSYQYIPIVSPEYWANHNYFMSSLFDKFAPMLNITPTSRKPFGVIRMEFSADIIMNKKLDWRGLVGSGIQAMQVII